MIFMLLSTEVGLLLLKLLNTDSIKLAMINVISTLEPPRVNQEIRNSSLMLIKPVGTEEFRSLLVVVKLGFQNG